MYTLHLTNEAAQLVKGQMELWFPVCFCNAVKFQGDYRERFRSRASQHANIHFFTVDFHRLRHVCKLEPNWR